MEERQVAGTAVAAGVQSCQPASQRAGASGVRVSARLGWKAGVEATYQTAGAQLTGRTELSQAILSGQGLECGGVCSSGVSAKIIIGVWDGQNSEWGGNEKKAGGREHQQNQQNLKVSTS